MEENHLSELFRQYYAGKLSSTEQSEFFRMIRDMPDERLVDLMQSVWKGIDDTEHPHFSSQVSQKIIENVMADRLVHPKATPRINSWRKNVRRWYAAAAIAFIVMSATAIYILRDGTEPLKVAGDVSEFELFAGGHQIILTDSDGRQLVLDSTYGALRVAADGLKYSKLPGDLPSDDTPYATRLADDAAEAVWHTLSVPRGSQYNITLADGTRVWLNAASNIKFPAKFTDNQRTIELKGEAYLEVAHKPKAPFSVIYDGGQVDVLGTSFNLRAYEGHAAQTTLFTGAVRMMGAKTAVTLNPGQIGTTQKDQIVIRGDATASNSIAWKSGLFVFEDTRVQDLLQDIERWYDITVTYHGAKPNKRLTGTISQRVPLAEVLQMLRFAGVDYTFENRKLKVL